MADLYAPLPPPPYIFQLYHERGGISFEVNAKTSRCRKSFYKAVFNRNTLRERSPCPGSLLPNAKCFEFLNTNGNDQEDEIYDSRSVSQFIFHRLKYIRNCFSRSFVQFITNYQCIIRVSKYMINIFGLKDLEICLRKMPSSPVLIFKF